MSDLQRLIDAVRAARETLKSAKPLSKDEADATEQRLLWERTLIKYCLDHAAAIAERERLERAYFDAYRAYWAGGITSETDALEKVMYMAQNNLLDWLRAHADTEPRP